jgi:hypothetical protein
LSESLWLDELHTAWVIADSDEQLAARAQIGNQSPCYFILERACDQIVQRSWRWLSGAELPYASEWSLRFLSLLAGGCLPWATYQLARKFSIPPPLALLAPLLTTLDPQFIFYAQEARCYALVQLVAVLHLGLSLARLPAAVARETCQLPRATNLVPTKRLPRLSPQFVTSTIRLAVPRIAWITSAILLFYLHYLTILLLVVNFALLLLAHRKPLRGPEEQSSPTAKQMEHTVCTRSTLVALVCDMLLVALAGIWGSEHVVAVAARRQNWLRFLPYTSWQSVWDWTSYLVVPLLASGTFFLVRQLVHQRRQPAEVKKGTGKSVILGHLPRIEPLLSLYLFACTFLPLLIAVAAYQLDLGPPLLYRYVIASATLLPIAVTRIISWTPGKMSRALVAFATLGLLGSSSYPVRELLTGQPPSPQRGEDWRGLCRELDEQLRAAPAAAPPPIILLCPALVEDWQVAAAAPALVEFCRFPLRSRYPLSLDSSCIWPLPTIDEPRLTIEQSAALEIQLRSRQPVILIVRGDELLADQIEAELLASLAQRNLSVRSVRDQRFAGLMMAKWQLR